MIYAVAVFAPLLGSLVSGLLGRSIGDRAAMAVSVLCMLLAAALGPIACYQLVAGDAEPGTVSLGTWVEAGHFQVSWALRYDPLAAVMVAMVTFVAMLIHVYSIGYMAHDSFPRYRFFAYLSLFTFSMLMLVTADNLLQLFFGWEGVGLCSYLLIGYWYDRPAANAAAIKAFIVNRIGDLAFAVGVALVFLKFGSIEFSTIFPAIAQHQGDIYSVLGGTFPAFEVIGVLLFIGAMGKSAQIGLHVWLPDAMEGPTPVSALIHAATMVTAGVFLVARMSPLYEFAPFALGMVTFIGASTALFAATIGCAQNDIKRVIAYSTCSQLGYMFVAAGVGVYPGVDLPPDHPCLLQGTAVPQRRLGDPCDVGRAGHAQDGRNLEADPGDLCGDVGRQPGARRRSPFAGYYSKDAIISAAYAAGTGIGIYGFICTVLAAFLTAFYSWRLLIMTFHGRPRADHHVMEHVHESPAVMLVPLFVLAAGALVAGFVLHPAFIGEGLAGVLERQHLQRPEQPYDRASRGCAAVGRGGATVMGLLGIATAYVMYMAFPLLPMRLATTVPRHLPVPAQQVVLRRAV